MSVGNASGMNVPALSLADADTKRQARRGLAIYFGVVIVLTALFNVLVIAFGPLWIIALMWSPAAASVVARLVLREGFPRTVGGGPGREACVQVGFQRGGGGVALRGKAAQQLVENGAHGP